VLPKSDLPMQIMAAPFVPTGKDPKGTTVAIAVGFRQPIRPAAERIVEDVELQVAAFNADGRSFGNTRGQATVTIRPNADGPAEYEVFAKIDLEPGRYQLRIAANVSSLEAAGSVYYDIDVPDFSAMPLSMSGLVLSASPPVPYGPKEGLGDLLPVVPTTRRAFTSAHKVAAFARVYQGRGARFDKIAVRTTIRDSADAVVFDRTQELARSAFSDGTAAVLVDLPTSTLPAGGYVLTMETSAGGQSIRRDSRFQISK
jgi:hypothetical protein